MSFEIELQSLGLFRPGLYFILRAQSSLMLSLLPLGCFCIVVEDQKIGGWGKTILSQPPAILNGYTFTATLGLVGHGLGELYLMCNFVFECEAFCISQPILPHEFAEILRKLKSREESDKAKESQFSMKFSCVQMNSNKSGS